MKLYKIIKKPPPLLGAYSYIKKSDPVVKSGPNARDPIIVPVLEAQYGKIFSKFATFFGVGDTMKSIIKGLHYCSRSLKDNPHTGKRTIDKETLAELEQLAMDRGMTHIAYTRVNPNYIFKDFEILFDTAIVIAMEMDRELIKTSPSKEFAQEIYRSYDELAKTALDIADWLRQRGYDAHPSPGLGGDVNTVPVGEDAGIGCIGKNGILITPEYGPCIRLTTIFVGIDNLPLNEKNDHMWIKDFCDTCNKCMHKCPAEAIHEPKAFEDGSLVYIDPEKCIIPFSYGCSDCIRNCVFTHGDYEKIKAAHFSRKNKEKGEESQ